MSKIQKKPKNITRYVVRKLIMASSALDAIRKEKDSPVNSVWIDEEYEKLNTNKELAPAMGFQEDES